MKKQATSKIKRLGGRFYSNYSSVIVVLLKGFSLLMSPLELEHSKGFSNPHVSTNVPTLHFFNHFGFYLCNLHRIKTLSIAKLFGVFTHNLLQTAFDDIHACSVLLLMVMAYSFILNPSTHYICSTTHAQLLN